MAGGCAGQAHLTLMLAEYSRLDGSCCKRFRRVTSFHPDSFGGPLREVGKVTRSGAGSGTGESTVIRVLGAEGPLRRVEEWWRKDMHRERGGF